MLWLDDIRNLFSADWLMRYAPKFAYKKGETIWVKSYKEFTDWITTNGLSDVIAFDHDLSDEMTGYDCTKWLVDYCIDNKVKLPQWTVQNANPVGKENINGMLYNFNKHF